jgi:hypothetical protein
MVPGVHKSQGSFECSPKGVPCKNIRLVNVVLGGSAAGKMPHYKCKHVDVSFDNQSLPSGCSAARVDSIRSVASVDSTSRTKMSIV